jgi:hypothetical protein
MVMSTFSVVPGTGNNMTTFGTLQALLNNANVQSGDVIQIEPGSTPGHIVDADIPNLQNLTIQGDPTADLSSIPYFYLDDHVSIDTTRQGFTFKHVQFDVTNGTLQLLANSIITDCHVKNDFAGEGIEVDGPTAAVISDSYIESDNSNSQQTNLVRVVSPGNSHDRITDNQFVALTGTNITLLDYAGAASSSDLIAHNTFNSNTSDGPLLQVEAGSQGLTIHSNTFTNGDPFGTGIEVIPDVQNLQIVDNVISVTNGNSAADGIVVAGSTSTTDSSMVISDNHIHAGGGGTGIVFTTPAPGVNLVAKVQDNDLTGNGNGVFLAEVGNHAPLSRVDLGGGPEGSLGGNDFRGDFRAIYTSAFTADGPVQAQMNIFSVADPTTVIYDHHNNSSLAAVVATNPLTASAAYVETLYLDFLHRTGAVNSQSDAGYWVALLGQGTPAATVASDIARSAEGAGVAVDGLYHRFLGRDADPAGRAGFVSYLQTGGTLEGVSQAMLASPEYQSHFQTDADFVQSLYQNLLHRPPSTAEVNGYLPLVAQLGRAAVAQGFLFSTEFRGDEVVDDYTKLLHRAQPPSAAEVNGWVGSNLDLLTIDTYFAASSEFQMNG